MQPIGAVTSNPPKDRCCPARPSHASQTYMIPIFCGLLGYRLRPIVHGHGVIVQRCCQGGHRTISSDVAIVEHVTVQETAVRHHASRTRRGHGAIGRLGECATASGLSGCAGP